MIYFFTSALLLVIIMQQFFIHKLINKLMSRNYYDYEVTQGVNKESPKNSQQMKVPVEQDFDDLGYLNPM